MEFYHQGKYLKFDFECNESDIKINNRGISIQKWRRGSENAQSIFEKLHHLSKILGDIKKSKLQRKSIRI